jgi:carbonic anhydrase
MNGTVKQMDIVEAGMMLKEVSKMHPMKWKRLGEERVMGLNKGQMPKVLAVGPRMVGGMSARYISDTSYSGKPGKVFEVTTTKSGWLDKVGAGSVYYAVKHLGVRKVDIWTNGGNTFRNSVASVREAAGNAGLEIREFSTSGGRFAEVGDVDSAVVSCSDSRVQAHDMYDNVVVVSNAGNVLSTTAIEVLTEAVEKGVPILMVMGHTKCGAVGAAVANNTEAELAQIVRVVGDNLMDDRLREDISPEILNALVSTSILKGERTPEYAGDDLKNLQKLVQEKGVEIMATFFDLSTGEVKEL